MQVHVLVAFDGSAASRQALEEAIRFAKPVRGRLRLLHVVDECALREHLADDATLLVDGAGLLGQRGLDILHEGGERVRAEGLECETVMTEFGSRRLADIVAHEARRWPARWIVAGTHGRRGLERLLVGSQAERILHAAPVPLMSVCLPGHRAPAAGEGERLRLLVPIDGSPASLGGLKEAMRIAQQRGGQLRLMHVPDTLSFFRNAEMPHMPAAEWVQMLRESGRRLLLRAAGQVRDAGLAVELALPDATAGPLHDLVAAEAIACGAHMIVMGMREGSDRRPSPWGSNALRVMRSAPVPVMVVPASVSADGLGQGADAEMQVA